MEFERAHEMDPRNSPLDAGYYQQKILDAYGTRGHALQQFTGDRLSIQPCGPLLCS